MIKNVVTLLVSCAFLAFVAGCSVLFLGCSAQSVTSTIAPSIRQSVIVSVQEQTSRQPLQNVSVIVDGSTVTHTDVRGLATVDVATDRDACISVQLDDWINTIGRVCARVGHGETWTFYLLHAN